MPQRSTTVTAVILTIALIAGLTVDAPADENGSCDSLYSLEAGNHTVWDFFSHPCPQDTDQETVVPPGVGVTVLGIWPVPVLWNPLGFPSAADRPLLNSLVSNGYGGGLEINGWLTPDFGLRLEIGVLDFPGQPGNAAFQVLPVTLGIEVRLLGNNQVFLYLAADGGVAVNGQNTSNVFVGTSGSPYLQGGFGLNIFMFQLEADYATIVQPLGASKNANPFFFVPVSLGLHL